jgi:DNA invertase Pin-like site-specific DNA recombinase
MEPDKIKDRCDEGRQAARKALAETGKTHRGKHGLGRKPVEQGADIATWRKEADASISETAEHFGISAATVKRYCAKAEASRVKQQAFAAAIAKDDRDTERALSMQRLWAKRIEQSLDGSGATFSTL